MKILLAHNFYQTGSPSGEDSVFRNEKLLLEQAGHEVVAFEKHSDSIVGAARKAQAALDANWSFSTYRELRKLVGEHRPDVAHFHNTFPLISPSAYRACHEAGVPTVQTLHNYRLICPGALLLRQGQPCETCIEGSLLSAVRHGCYRGSRTATAIVTTMTAMHRVRGTYRTEVDRYIALTDFARQRFIRGGLPAERIRVRPNCLMDDPPVGRGNGNFALYVGRLSAEKGVRTLVDAWSGIDFPLRIAGDGSLRPELEKAARDSGAPIAFLGYQQRPEILSMMRDATFLVIPSECYEGFPVTVLEALASGTAMAVSSIGALDEILTAPDHTLKFPPRDAATLRSTIRQLLADTQLQARMRAANRSLFEARYSASIALDSLLAVYAEVVRPAVAVA